VTWACASPGSSGAEQLHVNSEPHLTSNARHHHLQRPGWAACKRRSVQAVVMAQNARVSALTDELVHSILRFDPASNRQAYRHAKDIASRGLRGHQYARTNQFDVASIFAGLDEKFRVRSRDDLADALQMRLHRLEALTGNFKPDFLSLLLQLSDRPLENTKVEALDLLRPASPPLPLTWDQILDDDPYSDEDIWKDIDYAADSSGDEQSSKKRAKPRPSPPTSVDQDDTYDPAACLVPVEESLAHQVKSAQFWSVAAANDASSADITELQAVRETLFMLAGLPTNLYRLDHKQNTININSDFALAHAMPDTVRHLLSELLNTGRDIFRLRQWTKSASTLPLIQAFEAAVATRLDTYDRALAQLQQQHLTPHIPLSTSLLQLHAHVRSISEPLLRLAHIVADIEPRLLLDPLSHLEALFDRITLAQMTLETDVFKYLSCVFFDCIHIYLKPIRKWMETGELGSNDETFFVFESDSGSDATSLWHDRYVLRRDPNDNLRSPSFLQPAAKKIFNTGKSIVFLKELGIYGVGMKPADHEPRLDHVTVCGVSEELPISPFPELFQAAFDEWMRSKYSQASAVLRHHLVENSGLMRTLITLETLYLGKNGAVFEDFANALFERMDAGRKGWNDRYVLTEMTRGIFIAAMQPSDAEKIVVRSTKAKTTDKSVKGLATVSLDFALSWPIQNIIQRTSISVYQQIFTLLLQSYRTKFLLQRVRPARNAQNQPSLSRLSLKLQHRLTWFADTLRSYLTETAVFFTTQELNASMDKAEDIDEMAHVHLRCITKLKERTLLSKDIKPIYNAIIEILDLGVRVAKTVAGESTGKPKNMAVKSRKSAWQKGTPSVPAPAELSASDSDDDGQDKVSLRASTVEVSRSPIESLQIIDGELARLLPFVTAGLRSIGRVGAEPMWEQLAERLEWKDKKLRV
jgi:gamma-tubulin complex component 5